MRQAGGAQGVELECQPDGGPAVCYWVAQDALGAC